MKIRKAKKLADWINYLTGFTGYGPGNLMPKPARALGRKEKRILDNMTKFIETEKARRRNCYRNVCMDVLGEDPDDDW